MKQVEASQELKPDDKTRLLELYRQALRELESAGRWKSNTDGFAMTTKTAPSAIRDAKVQLALVPSRPSLDMDVDASVVRLQERQKQLEAELAEKRKDLLQLVHEPKRRTAWRIEMPKKIKATERRLEETKRQLATSSVEERPDFALARKSYYLARQQALKQRLLLLESESRSYDATADLLPLKRDLVAAQVLVIRRTVKALGKMIQKRRSREVEDQIKVAEQLLSGTSTALKYLAERNLELTRQRKKIRKSIELTAADLLMARSNLIKLTEEISRTKAKVEAIGLSSEIGVLLRTQQASLHQYHAGNGDARKRKSVLQSVQLPMYEMQDRRSDLLELDTQLSREMEQISQDSINITSEELESAVRDFLDAERHSLDLLVADYHVYFNALVDLSATEQQINNEVDQYAAYIDERVLWIRSSANLGFSDLSYIADAIKWLFQRTTWESAADQLVGDWRQHPTLYILAIAGCGGLFLLSWSVVWRMGSLGGERIVPSTNRFLRASGALMAVVLLALPWPTLIWFVGWRLVHFGHNDPFAVAVGSGLGAFAKVLLPLSMLRHACRQHGLAHRHLDWYEPAVNKLRQYVTMLMIVVLPLTFITAIMRNQGNPLWRESVGRIGFVAILLSLTVFAERLLRPRRGILHEACRVYPGLGLLRFRHIWYGLVVGAYVALILLAISGYYYTAFHLSLRLQISLLLVLGLLMIGTLLLYRARVNRRRLAIDRCRQQRVETESASPVDVETEIPVLIAHEPVIDPTEIERNMRRLLTGLVLIPGVIGLWLIWVDVLPALTVVSRIDLWHTSVDVAETMVADDGSVSTRIVQRHVPITLAKVALVTLIIGITFLTTRNIKGLFELPFLDRLQFGVAMRDTIATVARYILWTVGLVFCINLLGFGWANIQWIVAALSVGLGFGLQDIFANFMSGLILLFERPIRVNDIITIGDTTGVVTQIRIRATTIMDWDRKELVVPNKEFTTGRLLNWTLTNKITRRVIRVAVAYGSDTELVQELLLKVAAENVRVLADPKPRALIEEFGDNGMVFTLRAYHGKISDRLSGRHELHVAIYKAFNEAGIVIVFPQRDVHLHLDPEASQLLQIENVMPTNEQEENDTCSITENKK